MLDFREIGLRHDTSFIRNLRAGFEPRDSSFQGGAIDHPPDKDGQQGTARGKEQQRISGFVYNPIA